jgi:ferredoxin-fold anticodon binding domain-containing protein
MLKQSSDLMTALKAYMTSDSTQDATTQTQMESLVTLVEQQKIQIENLQNAANNDETKLDEINNTQKGVMDQITVLVTAQLNAGVTGDTRATLQELLAIEIINIYSLIKICK